MINEARRISTPRANSVTRRLARILLGAALLSALFTSTSFAQNSEARSDEALRSARESSDRKDFDGAAATLRRALRDDPENTEMLSLLARVLAWSRHYDESIATYRKLLARHPDDAFDRAGYARALAWSGRSEKAIPEFRRALKQDSTDAETRIGYARALSWDGDLAGASKEYFRVLERDRKSGDAWLGLATVARWRDAPAASDAFAERAAAHGADSEGLAEERGAVRMALRPSSGTGWMRTRERQITSDSTAFQLETAGEFLDGRATLGRSVGVSVRASRLRHWEKADGPPSSVNLNYDLKSTGFAGDLSFLRSYPIQFAGGIAYRRFEARNPGVLFPLGVDDDFFGFNSRLWGYVGRFTPSAGVRRDFIAIKTIDAVSGLPVLIPGGGTNADLGLRWDGSGRLSASSTFSKTFFTDDNERTSAGGLVAYRLRGGIPRLTVDYGLTWADFSKPSPSYFTPLQSVRHAAGLAMSGYSERASIDYGARYELSFMQSANFSNIASNVWSANVGGTLLNAIPLGVEGYYSVDNHSYRTWGLTLSGSVRW